MVQLIPIPLEQRIVKIYDDGGGENIIYQMPAAIINTNLGNKSSSYVYTGGVGHKTESTSYLIIEEL